MDRMRHATPWICLFGALTALGCVAGAPFGQPTVVGSLDAQTIAQTVTLTVDPTASVASQRRVLATIESQLALVLDAVTVTQANGQTRFNLQVRNGGAAIEGLRV